MAGSKSSVVLGLPELKRTLDGLPKKLQNKVLRKECRKQAKVFAAEVKSRAPVVTGAVRASVKVRSAKRKKNRVASRVSVSGGHKDSIIGFIELGRIGQTANPFIRTSFHNKVDSVKGEMLENIKKGIEDLPKSS